MDTPAPAPCPACDAGHLLVIHFKARPNPWLPSLPQLGEHPEGGIRPTVVVRCTAGCGFVAEGPGTIRMVGTLVPGDPDPGH